MLYAIKNGDILECLNCGKDIEVNRDTVILTHDGEFICCDCCGVMFDIQMYHLYGKRKDNGK